MIADIRTSLIIGAAIVAAAFILKPERQAPIGRYQAYNDGDGAGITFVLDTVTGERWIGSGKFPAGDSAKFIGNKLPDLKRPP